MNNHITTMRRYQIAKVYRRDKPSKGRYREFYQCDFDIAGVYEPMQADFEVIKVLTELLDKLDIGMYEIKLNHRKLLDGMLEICGVPPETFRTVCSSIDKLDKLTFEEVKKELVRIRTPFSASFQMGGLLLWCVILVWIYLSWRRCF
jgi:histidyl-tRNA synthetase